MPMFKLMTVMFIQVLCGMEMDLFVPSFPELQRVFNLSPVLVQMTISANFITYCICSLFAGALGDKFNRRTVLISGLGIFVIGSLMCVAAPNYWVLILGRILQGMGISAPAVLSLPILLENCAPDKQPGMMGMVNGVKTLAIAIAPVIGSFVNLYFSWRGNFSVLLGMGVVCLMASLIAIPNKVGNHSVSLSLKTYIPLLLSKKLMMTIGAVSFITASYWMFTGMAPIYYMEGMNVSLAHYGYYQGSLSATFAAICIMSPMLFTRWGEKRCLIIGIALCFLSAVLLLVASFVELKQPLLITGILLLFSMGAVFPINILYPRSLEIIPHARGRSAGLAQSIVLFLTASMLEVVAYFYTGEFMPIGLAMFISIMLSLIILQRLFKKKWLSFSSAS